MIQFAFKKENCRLYIQYIYRRLLTGGILGLIALALLSCSEQPTSINASRQPKTIEPVLLNSGPGCEEGIQPNGALYRICFPANWNGDLIIYAHGYVKPQDPLALPADSVDDFSISEIITSLGFAFATTSYRANGLVVREGILDIAELLQEVFVPAYGQPRYVYLVGASEGGLITTLTVEQYPELFDGGLPTCGPVGDFQKQIDFIGDFRVVFDYFFPGIIPGSPVEIPDEVIENWDEVYKPLALEAVRKNTLATIQLLSVTEAPVDPIDLNSVEETVEILLGYNIFATNNAIQVLGGQPFDNQNRRYSGSLNDARLNDKVQRFSADPEAHQTINNFYQTTGKLQNPLVNMHTLLDPLIPYWQADLYQRKVKEQNSAAQYVQIPIPRYGHCNFKVYEVLAAFAILVFKVAGEPLLVSERLLASEISRQNYMQIVSQYGIMPAFVSGN